MTRVSKKSVLATSMLLAIVIPIAGCPNPIIPFLGVPPAAAMNLDGTYLITLTDPNDDPAALPSGATVVISGGLLTRILTTNVTPTSVTNTGNNFVWMSAAMVTYLGASYRLDVTLNTNLQPDNTLTGTFSATGQSTVLEVLLTKQ